MQYTRDGAADTNYTDCFQLSICPPFWLSRFIVRHLQQMEVKQVHFPFMLSSIFITSSLEMCDGVIFTAGLVSAENLSKRVGNVEKEKALYDLVSESLTVRFEVSAN